MTSIFNWRKTPCLLSDTLIKSERNQKTALKAEPYGISFSSNVPHSINTQPAASKLTSKANI